MKFTATPPTEPGLFWWKGHAGSSFMMPVWLVIGDADSDAPGKLCVRSEEFGEMEMENEGLWSARLIPEDES